MMQKLMQTISRHIMSGGFGPPPRSSSFQTEIEKLISGSPRKAICLLLVLCYWLIAVPSMNKLVGVVFASVFSVCEYWFVRLDISPDPNNPVESLNCYTTPEQWFAHAFWFPILYPIYRFIVPQYWIQFSIINFDINMNLCSPSLAFLFAWVLEILEGYCLIFLFGFNRAWQYFGNDAFFDGTIKLGHGVFWIILGFFIDITMAPILSQMDIVSLWPWTK